jgi:hypothetical protein
MKMMPDHFTLSDYMGVVKVRHNAGSCYTEKQ